MSFFSSLIVALRKLLTPLPHLPLQLLKPLVPFLSWYIFLRGLFAIIGGLQSISWGFRYNSLPAMFVTLLDINPTFFVVGGVIGIIAGGLYLKAFPALAEPSRRHQGWQQWTMATAVITMVHLYETLFLAHSFFWLIISTLISWYLIFEFEKAIGSTATPAKKKPSARV